MIKRYGSRQVPSFMAKWLAEREVSDPYREGRRFARENREDMEGLLLFRQGLIDEVMSWDHKEGVKLLTGKTKGMGKHADKTKKQH